MIHSLARGLPHPTRVGFVLLGFEPGDLLRVVFGLRICPGVKEVLKHVEGQ